MGEGMEMGEGGLAHGRPFVPLFSQRAVPLPCRCKQHITQTKCPRFPGQSTPFSPFARVPRAQGEVDPAMLI